MQNLKTIVEAFIDGYNTAKGHVEKKYIGVHPALDHVQKKVSDRLYVGLENLAHSIGYQAGFELNTFPVWIK